MPTVLRARQQKAYPPRPNVRLTESGPGRMPTSVPLPIAKVKILSWSKELLAVFDSPSWDLRGRPHQPRKHH